MPIPVPVYVPVPMHMYSQSVPVPTTLPVPVSHVGSAGVGQTRPGRLRHSRRLGDAVGVTESALLARHVGAGDPVGGLCPSGREGASRCHVCSPHSPFMSEFSLGRKLPEAVRLTTEAEKNFVQDLISFQVTFLGLYVRAWPR